MKTQKSIRKFLVAVGVMFAGAAVGAVVWGGPMVAGFSPDNGRTATVRIPADASFDELTDSLKASLGDKYAAGVIRAWKLFRAVPSAAHGLYVVERGTPAYRLARRLQYGRQTPVKVTFNNIRTLDMLADRVGAKMEFDAADFIAACDSVLPSMGFRGRASFPAAFLPDTYEFYWTADARYVVETFARVRNLFWNDERRAKAKSLGLNPVGVATVASIVEEETASSAERPLVARLYLNRLAKGMKLQADPTVKFAVGDFSLRRITGGHLRKQSAYNTYIHEGLPPGPIRIPEPLLRQSLRLRRIPIFICVPNLTFRDAIILHLILPRISATPRLIGKRLTGEGLNDNT